MSFTVSEPYRPRPAAFLRLLERDGWRLKLYSIRHGERPLDFEGFERGLVQAFGLLPTPAVTARRPGVGFVIFHQGRGCDYLVLNWWDNENELFNRVLVRSQEGDGDWRAASDGETACVWDLEIIARERDAYVSTVLKRPGREPYVEAYLAAVIASPPA